MWKARTRETFLQFYSPVLIPTQGQPFRRKWQAISTGWVADTDVSDTNLLGAQQPLSGVGEEQNWVFPKVMDIADGLVIPEWVVQSNDTFPRANYKAIQKCMEDLVEYVLSGRHTADFLSDEKCAEIERSLLRIAVEEGVVIVNG